MRIEEIQIVPIKPIEGLVAFASCVIDGWLFLGSIGIYTRLDGGYRLTYPTKNGRIKALNIFHPINKQSGQYLEEAIINKFEDVMKQSNDRYSGNNVR